MTDAPRITIVTPSYNQGRFLDSCMRSVLDQNYPDLEYIVVDGGSTDGSIEVIKAHEARLASWVSEPDAGHYDALDKGFRRSTGEILGWLNADDLHTPWALAVVADIFRTLPTVDWLTTLFPLFWGEDGRPIQCGSWPGVDPRAVLRGDARIQQESTFWRRRLWEGAGGRLDTSLALAADVELWARFACHAQLHGVAVPLAGIRQHADQRHVRHADAYRQEAAAVAARYPASAVRRTGPLRSALRLLRPIAASRRPVRAVCERMSRRGWLYRGTVVCHRGGAWGVEEVFFP